MDSAFLPHELSISPEAVAEMSRWPVCVSAIEPCAAGKRLRGQAEPEARLGRTPQPRQLSTFHAEPGDGRRRESQPGTSIPGQRRRSPVSTRQIGEMPCRALHQAHDVERLVRGDGQSPLAGSVAETAINVGAALLEFLRTQHVRRAARQGEAHLATSISTRPQVSRR